MKTYAIPADLLDLATSCIARAEHERAFDGCALPGIGRHTLARLEHLRKPETISINPRFIVVGVISEIDEGEIADEDARCFRIRDLKAQVIIPGYYDERADAELIASFMNRGECS